VKLGSKNRALNYIPKSNRIIGQPIYSQPINLLGIDGDKNLSNYTHSNNPQTLDNTELDNRIESQKPINQLNKDNRTEDLKSNESLNQLNLREGEL